MALSSFNLNGKIALITGATQGIGAALARGFGEAGATVVVNARDRSKLDTFVSSLGDSGIKAYGSFFDITVPASVKTAVEEIETNIGPIDILVNNAGVIKRFPAEDL